MTNKIRVGDWFLYHDGVYHCSYAGEGETHIQYSLGNDEYAASVPLKACTRLPASPRELISLWKRVVRLYRRRGTRHTLEDMYDVISFLAVRDKHKRAKRKGKK